MVYNFNFNGTLPWIYKKEKYADKISTFVGSTRIPSISFGKCYYTYINSTIGWSAVIVKSLVLIDNQFVIIVELPNGIEYILKSYTHPFFETKDELKKYLKGENNISIPNSDVLFSFNHLFQGVDFIKPYMDGRQFAGYKYKNGLVNCVKMSIKYLWIDKNGLHYQLISDEENLYITRADAVENNLTIMDFENENTESINEKKYSIIVEVTAKSIEDAILKIRIKE